MPTSDCDDIRSTLRKHLPDLADRFGVRSLALFGSFARNENRPGSDVDILVTFERTPGLLRFIELESSLGDLLGRKVDLVLKDALKPAIGRQVLSETLPVKSDSLIDDNELESLGPSNAELKDLVSHYRAAQEWYDE